MFDEPQYLWLLILIPLFVGLFVWRGRHRANLLRQLGDSTLVQRWLIGATVTRPRLKAGLWLACITMLIIALAQPVWGLATERTETRGIAIMLVLDVSVSMDAEDVLPSRLERAKLAIREILANNRGNEFGLILFAGTAFVQLPLTADINVAMNFLNAVDTDVIGQQGTALEVALQLALDSLNVRTAEQSMIVLFSDGENHSGEPLRVAEVIAERGIPIHTVGYGNAIDGAPIPLRDDDTNEVQGYKSDRFGNLVLTRLNEEILQDIAQTTGGLYRAATDSGIEIVDLLNRIAEAETGELGARTDTQRIDRFSIFVALAVLFLTMEIFSSGTRQTDA